MQTAARDSMKKKVQQEGAEFSISEDSKEDNDSVEDDVVAHERRSGLDSHKKHGRKVPTNRQNKTQQPIDINASQNQSGFDPNIAN